MDVPLPPVWQRFPHIPRYSIGWRMGPGEDYWGEWASWFIGLSGEERASYRKQWPEPGKWAGFYDFIETSYKILPTREEQWAQIEAAAGPIRNDELEITDPSRIIWLTLNGLKADDSGDDLLCWIDGSKWRKFYDGPSYRGRLVRQIS